MANFNPYIDKIDMDFWRELCAKEGKLCLYKKGDYFLHCGDITRNVW
ncbi:Crp/Fnr family transcriptional regulator, partial [Bacteroides uniformis]